MQNLDHSRSITPKHVTSGGAHLRDLAPGQHSSDETSQRQRAVDNIVFDLTGEGNKSRNSRTHISEKISTLLSSEVIG